MRTFGLLAFDLDGTLLNSQGCLDPETTAFLQQAQAAGIHCVGATGRRLYSALPILQGAGIHGFTVTQNGAVVADVQSARTDRLRAIPRTAALDVVARIEEHGLCPLWYCHAPLGPGELFVARERPDPSGFVAGYLEYARGHHTMVPSLVEAPGDAVVRLTAHHREREPLESLRPVLHEHTEGLRSFVGLDPVHQVYRLEVLHAEASKWAGVEWVARELAIPTESTLAVGDDANDADLLQNAGYSLAAPVATPAAVQAARAQVEGDGPAAVVSALRRLLELPS